MSMIRMSLATRLAALFCLVTAVVFSTAGWHLYHSLNQQLQRHDDIALLGTAEIMRHQLVRRGGIEAVHTVINLLQAAYGPHGVMLAIRDAGGQLLAASTTDAERLPSDSPLADEYSPDLGDIRDWSENGEKKGRMIVAWQRTSTPAGSKVILTMAQETRETGIVVDEHGREVLWTLLAGIVATALLGYIVARQGLAPIKTIASAAGNITANQLNERLRIEDAPAELQDMVRAFNSMLDRLEESFRRLTQFSSDIAHELRTPLSNLMIETQVALAKRRSIPEYEALLGSNIEEVERLSRMIRDMLFLAKADNPETAIETVPVDLGTEFDKVVEFCGTLLEERDLTVTRNGAGVVKGDKTLLQRAMYNILVNAIRHSTRGGVIEATIKSTQPGLTDLVISNPGPGIAPEHLPRIFDRFYRADSARQNSAEGSGLGLAIVQSIARLHRGEVSVTSCINDRTVFTLRLPVALGQS